MQNGLEETVPAGVLFLVPARGGSVRVPNKNLRCVDGVPLVARAIRTAIKACEGIEGHAHAVVCSTDDASISRVARAWGAEVITRPPALATADATSVDVALHALALLSEVGREFRALVLVQATSPLTLPEDLIAVVELHDREGDPVVTVTPSHPATWHGSMSDDGRLNLIGGADAGELLLSGSAYAIAPADLRRDREFILPGRTRAHVIPPSRSIDIDEELDLVIAEALVQASR